MIYVKKLLASCAALALAATSMLPMTAAAAEGKITLESKPTATSIKSGETVKYELKIKENDGVNGWSVLVEFDTDKLTYEKVTSKKIVENVEGYDGISTETKIVSPVPKSDQEGNSFPIVWAEGTKTYAEIWEENEKDLPAELEGKNYVYTGINNNNPVAEIVFTANTDIPYEDLEGLVTVSGTKAVKNDASDPQGKFDVDIDVINSIPDPVKPSLTIDETATVEEEKTVQLTATTKDTTGTVSWKSSDDTIATVDPDTGLVTGVAEGTATITASVDDLTATCTVTVTKKQAEEPTKFELPDQTIKEKETLEFDVKTLIPTITAEQVAAIPVSIDDTNVVTYKTEGTKVIFTGVKAGVANVTVTSPSPNWEFTPFKITVLPEGTPVVNELDIPDQEVTEGLSTSYDLSNALLATILPYVEVESLDPDVATVELSSDKKNLVITGKKAGTADAQVKLNGTVVGTFKITVTAPEDGNEFTADFKEKNIDLKLGGTSKLAIVVDPEDETSLPFTDITKWTLKSSDDTIVSVDPDGTIVGLRSGEATITATNPDYNGTLTAKITVKTVFPVYVPTSPVNPGETANVKPGDYNPGRAKVTPYVNAIVDSESKAGVIAATGGEMDSETGNAPAIAAAALGLIALGFVVVARKKRHA